MSLFQNTFHCSSTTRILDVGGVPELWEKFPIAPNLTFLNLPGTLRGASDRHQFVIGDGRMLPFPDRSFDIVFSNSVIEHVGDRNEQRCFAGEIVRVGRAYWVQTPNRKFPIEQHSMLPAIHFLPSTIQSAILKRITLWERITHPKPEERDWFVNHLTHELRLLDSKELQAFFPEAKIVAEPFLGVVKSLIAVG